MSIIDRIEQAKITNECDTGHKPSSIYLGYEDFLELAVLIDRHPIVQMNRREQRPQVNGLLVYRVDANNYLDVS